MAARVGANCDQCHRRPCSARQAHRVQPSREGAPGTTTSPATPLQLKWLYTRCPTLVSCVPSLRSQDASVIQQLTTGLRPLGATVIRGFWGLSVVNHRAGGQRCSGILALMALYAGRPCRPRPRSMPQRPPTHLGYSRGDPGTRSRGSATGSAAFTEASKRNSMFGADGHPAPPTGPEAFHARRLRWPSWC